MRPAEQLSLALANQLERLLTPALVIDLGNVEHNVTSMIQRCEDASRWRPHVKTTKQAVVIDTMLDCGVRHFKCATVDELAMTLGCAKERKLAVDVLVAYPLRRAACTAVLEVRAAHPQCRVQLLADSPAHAMELSGWVQAHAPVDLHLDVDLGMGRTGTPPDVWSEAIAGDFEATIPSLRISGLHGYDGHHRWGDRPRAWMGYDQLCRLARELGDRELDVITSGTHSYAHALEHPRLRTGPFRHQVSAGTIVFSDLRSSGAAADLGLRQAAFVASRVVHRGQGRVTLDAGSKAISPDGTPPVCKILDWPGLEAQRASEEHLPVEVRSGPAPSLGDLLWLVPDHICTTVNLYRSAIWLRNGRYVGHGPIDAASHPVWVGDPPKPR